MKDCTPVVVVLVVELLVSRVTITISVLTLVAVRLIVESRVVVVSDSVT